jgi:hypothetical protein
VYFTANPSRILRREWRPYRVYRGVIKLNHNGPARFGVIPMYCPPHCFHKP